MIIIIISSKRTLYTFIYIYTYICEKYCSLWFNIELDLKGNDTGLKYPGNDSNCVSDRKQRCLNAFWLI